MAARNKVSNSFSFQGGELCVDIFVRTDGSFGFEEYRRDVEDQSGWFSVGFFGGLVFETEADALRQARAKVPWLDRQLSEQLTTS